MLTALYRNTLKGGNQKKGKVDIFYKNTEMTTTV